jgi:uncharacterized protein YgiM (DUF1202 family)
MTDHRLTNLDTNDQQIFSNTPAGLRPLHVLPVAYLPLNFMPGQSFNHACAAACGVELIQAYKLNDTANVSSVLEEMEANQINELTFDRLNKILDAHGVPTQRETVLNLFDLFTRLKANKPLILLLNFSMTSLPSAPLIDDTRFVVLVGMDNSQACIHDPAALAGSGDMLCLALTIFENALSGATANGVINKGYDALTPVFGLNDTAFGGGPLYSVLTTKKVNIRSGPAITFGDIGDVPAGVIKAIFEEGSDHSYGKIAPGQWINLSADFVTRLTNAGTDNQAGGALNPPSSSIPGSHPVDSTDLDPVNIPASQPNALYRVRIINSVNIRSGPSMSSTDVGGLQTGTECDILEENPMKTFGRIAPNQWIILNSLFVQRLSDPVPANPPGNGTTNLPPVNIPVGVSEKLYRVRVINGVNIRSRPTISSNSVGTLPRGAERDILAENADKTYGKIADDRWITLSSTFVKKI